MKTRSVHAAYAMYAEVFLPLFPVLFTELPIIKLLPSLGGQVFLRSFVFFEVSTLGLEN